MKFFHLHSYPYTPFIQRKLLERRNTSSRSIHRAPRLHEDNEPNHPYKAQTCTVPYPPTLYLRHIHKHFEIARKPISRRYLYIYTHTHTRARVGRVATFAFCFLRILLCSPPLSHSRTMKPIVVSRESGQTSTTTTAKVGEKERARGVPLPGVFPSARIQGSSCATTVSSRGRNLCLCPF